MTMETFAPMFVELATQLRATDADELAIRTYFNALHDVEAEFLQMAAEHLARTAQWFPKTSEWRTAALTIAYQRQQHLRDILRRLPQPLCQWCEDTGWAPVPDTNRVMKCDCTTLRWQEILGRRPWPQLPNGQELQTQGQ
jgi:hypothetical protein